MKILVDADACPVIRQVERLALKYDIPVVLLCDTNHIIKSDYSEVKIISSGADAVDFALVNMCNKGDLVVSQDYGVAAMVLSKGGLCIHQSGKIFTDDNIGGLLMYRHLAKKARMAKNKNHLKGPKKRTKDDDEKFEIEFEKLLIQLKDSVAE